MNLQEKSIDCFECGITFIFSVEEQQAFQAMGRNHSPKRCPSCRDVRKDRQIKKSEFIGFRIDRRLFPATCARCGQSAQVPFEPQSGRPVYCRTCYQTVKVTQ